MLKVKVMSAFSRSKKAKVLNEIELNLLFRHCSMLKFTSGGRPDGEMS